MSKRRVSHETPPTEDCQEDSDSEITEESRLQDTSESENDADAPIASKGNEQVPAKRQKWSNHCKLLLLKALKKYGHHDIQQIWKALPDKSLASIRAMIHKIKAKSRKVYKRNEAPLNDWLKSGWLSKEESMVPQALLFMRLFEKQPRYPQESIYDFKAVYHYLHNLMLGCPAQNIPEETENMLYMLLSSITKDSSVKKASREEIFDFLRRTYRRKQVLRTYPGKTSHSSESQNSMLNQKHFSI